MKVLISLFVDCFVSILTLAVFGKFCNCPDHGCVSHELSCDSPLLAASHGLEGRLCKRAINNTIQSRQRRSCSQNRIGSQDPKRTEPLLNARFDTQPQIRMRHPS
jgi:hypothetical protein